MIVSNNKTLTANNYSLYLPLQLLMGFIYAGTITNITTIPNNGIITIRDRYQQIPKF